MSDCKRRSEFTESDLFGGPINIFLSSPMGLLIIALLLSGFATASAQDVRQETQASLEAGLPQQMREPQTLDRGLSTAAPIAIEGLTLGSDFTVFMTKDCPDDVRLRALRRLWTLMPHEPFDENSAI